MDKVSTDGERNVHLMEIESYTLVPRDVTYVLV